MSKTYDVLIVDDHAILRDGLKSIISTVEQFNVIGEASGYNDALQAAQTLDPHVVTIDISLPDGNGLKLTKEIATILPDTKILIVSMHAKVPNISEAFRSGANGFVAKESAADQLLRGLETIVQGERFIDDSLAPLLIESLTGQPNKNSRKSPDYQDYESLTPREREVLALLAEGLTAKETAANLHISPKTVENHRANIMKKLDLHTTVELVRYCARIGIIDLGD